MAKPVNGDFRTTDRCASKLSTLASTDWSDGSPESVEVGHTEATPSELPHINKRTNQSKATRGSHSGSIACKRRDHG